MINKIIGIAKEAAEVIKEGFGKNITIEFKTDESNLVTEIDKKSEDIIINFIKKEFPSHNILSEESGIHKASSDYVWVIDPLDGTTNFAHKLPIFAVSIGLQKGDEILAGVIVDVMQNIVYAAELKGGAYAGSKKIYVNQNEIFTRSVLVTGFPYDIQDNPGSAIEVFGEMLKSVRAIRRLGSAAIDLCYTASGVFDGFWEINLNPWDVAAGKLIVEEAGGLVTDYSGKEMNIFSKQIVASNKVIHNSLLKVIKSVYK